MGNRFKLFAMACLVIGPLWMWAYHEDVPVAVSAWDAALTAYESVAGLSARLADDVSSAIPSDVDLRRPSGETKQQKYPAGKGLNRSDIERLVIEFTNKERIGAGLRPLRHDVAISKIARSHSENMARLGLMSHDIGGRGPTDRALNAGYNCRAYSGDGSYTYGLSENVAEHPRVVEWMGWGTSYRPVDFSQDAGAMARELVDGWMSSPGHRKNILDSDSRRIGVGVAIRESPEYGYTSETVYATQNFSECR